MSSARQTKKTSDSTGKSGKPLFSPLHVRLLGVLVLLAGWALIIHKHQSSLRPLYVSPSAIFMCIGWVGLLITAYFLWRSGMSAASEGDIDEESYWRPVGRRRALEVEKRNLLKAIKEIEFDRELGKMSDADAKSLSQVYRKRAINVIKALDELQDEQDKGATVRDKIDKDIKARLEIDRAAAKARRKKKNKKKKGARSEATS